MTKLKLKFGGAGKCAERQVGGLGVVCHVLPGLQHDVVLGMDFLAEHNPVIDFVARDMVLPCGLRVSSESSSANLGGNVELCSLHQVRKFLKQEGSEAWFCTIRASTGDAETTEQDSDVVPSRWQLLCQEFSDVFAQPGLPRQRDITHDIHLVDENVPPAKQRAYRMSARELEEVRAQLQDYLSRGWIRPSASSFGSPILFVRKKDGSLRMCVDYRALNARTVRDVYPIPRVDDLLDRLTHATIFSKIDLTKGYHQVAITPEHVHKTAFTTRYGLFEFLVLPFGLTNAPSTFQRLMNTVFDGVLDLFVTVYLDDVLVFSSTEDEHETHLREVLSRLRAHGLHARRDKCNFGVDCVEYLGHWVKRGERFMDPGKVSDVLGWPELTTVKQVQQFLGLANYYSTYIRDFATIAAPLTDLLQQGNAFVWGPTQGAAFAAIKQAITSAPNLALPDFGKPFVVESDASVIGIGAVLLQDVGDGRGERPVAFFSRKLNSTERNYDTTDRELLAVILSCKRWRPYLHGRQFVVRTDHEPLLTLRMQPGLSSRRLRWLEQLAEFDVQFVHLPGRDNVVADALSRPPLPSVELHDVSDQHVHAELGKWLGIVAPHVTLADTIDSARAALMGGRRLCAIRCPACSGLHLDTGRMAVRKHVEHVCSRDECQQTFTFRPAVQGNPLAVFTPSVVGDRLYVARLPGVPDLVPQSARLSSLVVEPTFLDSLQEETAQTADPRFQRLLALAASEAGHLRRTVRAGRQVLVRDGPHGEQLCIPPGRGLRQLLLSDVHGASHFGTRRTLALLQQRVWWPSMVDDVRNMCRACEICQKAKDRTTAQPGHMQPVEIPTARFQTWTMDFITDLPLSDGCNCVFTCVEKLSRYVVLIPCFMGDGVLGAQQVADLFFQHVVSRFGVPHSVLHDRDPRFTSSFWTQLWARLGTRVRLSTAYHPQTDGQTERAHRTVEQVLRCLLSARGVPDDQWVTFLPHVSLAINGAVSSATGKSPHQLVYGVDLALPVDHALQTPQPNVSAEEAAQRAVHYSSLARRSIARAQEQQAAYVNRHREDISFAAGDLVLLSSRHLPLESTRKLQPRWLGPFKVLKAVGPVAYRLELPARWKGVHPTFHVGLLRRWVGKLPELPPPVLVDGCDEYEVERVVGHRATRRGLRYTVRWRGYGPEEDSAMHIEDLQHCLDLVRDYHRAQGLPAVE